MEETMEVRRCPLCNTYIKWREYLEPATGAVTCPACLRKFNEVNLK